MKYRTTEHKIFKYIKNTVKVSRIKIKWLFLIMSLTFLVGTSVPIFAEETVLPEDFVAEQKMHQLLKDKGYETSYVSFEDSVLLVRIEASGMEMTLPLDWIEIAVIGNELFVAADRIIVEAYIDKKPMLSFTMDASDVGEYSKEALTLNDFIEKVEVEDTRSREDLLRESLLPLNVSIHDIRIDNNSIEVFAYYFGVDEKGMIEDYISIAHASLHSAPWVDKVVVHLSIEYGLGEITFLAKTNDILDLLEENITEESFFSRVSMNTKAYEQLTGGKRTLNKAVQTIRSLPNGNTVLLLIMVIVAIIIISLILKIIRYLFKKRKSIS